MKRYGVYFMNGKGVWNDNIYEDSYGFFDNIEDAEDYAIELEEESILSCEESYIVIEIER